MGMGKGWAGEMEFMLNHRSPFKTFDFVDYS